MKCFKALLFLFAFVASAGYAHALDSVDKAIDAARAAEGKTVGDYLLRDQDGREFKINELRGKPFVLSFVYTTCTHTCSPMTASLAEAFKKAGPDFGKKFASVTVGFDAARDTPTAMKAYGGLFTKDFGAWRFASADGATIDALAKDVGFSFRKSGSGFDHPNIAAVIGSDGKVASHLYGPDFRAEDVLAALAAANGGGAKPAPPKPRSFIERLKLLCYTYDETTGTYRPDYYIIVGVTVVMLLQAALASVVFYVFYSAKKRRRSVGG